MSRTIPSSFTVELVSTGSNVYVARSAEVIQTVVTSPQKTHQSESDQQSSSPSSGWIVAIVALVLLAIAVTIIGFTWWNSRRKRRGYRGSAGWPRPRSEYYEISKPPSRRQQLRSSLPRRSYLPYP